VTNSFAKIPLVEYDAWGDFVAAAPYAATWVAVEMGGEPLETFEHPKRAVYILGSEDHGIPGTVLRACHRTVALPSVRYSSFNVAVSGSIVMYDRVAKQACFRFPRARHASFIGASCHGVAIWLFSGPL
jgi:tRNA(Leu) C34 or U34 (ribose-2'-O)-methylase TrmL